MKTAIILHGKPSKKEYFNPRSAAQSNKHWLPWIQRQLILREVLAQTPELPEAYEPEYEKWRRVFEQFEIDDETMLIGHSCGGGFLVRWLSESKTKVGKVALIAPWLDPDHELNTPFFDFEIDSDLVDRTRGAGVFFSADDDEDILISVDRLKKVKGIHIKEFKDKGHFTLGDMKTEKFPELLEFLVS